MINYCIVHCEKKQRKEAIDFIRSNHYSKSISKASSPVFMLIDENNEMVGAMAFHHPSSENVIKSVYGGKYTKNIKELHKLFIIDNTPKNTESFFISQALKQLKIIRPDIHTIISYADTTEGHKGTIYKASNFFFCGSTNTKSVFYRDPVSNKLIHPRQNGKNISKKTAIENGWILEKRGTKIRFVFINCASRKRKFLINELKWEIING